MSLSRTVQRSRHWWAGFATGALMCAALAVVLESVLGFVEFVK